MTKYIYKPRVLKYFIFILKQNV